MEWMMEMMGMDQGWGNSWGGGSWGGGQRYQNKLKEIDNSLKVWVGNLAPAVDWKELQNHFATIGRVQWTEVLSKGTACVAYKTAEDVAKAISNLNGSQLGGQHLQVDAWEGKPKEQADGVDGASTGNGKGGGKGWTVQKPMFTKPVSNWASMYDFGGSQQGSWGDNKMKKIDASKKVWVGNLPADSKWKDLEKHFKKVGNTTWAEVMKNGTGCIAFKTAEEAQQAIATLNGSEFNGAQLQVDSWTQGKSATAE